MDTERFSNVLSQKDLVIPFRRLPATLVAALMGLLDTEQGDAGRIGCG